MTYDYIFITFIAYAIGSIPFGLVLCSVAGYGDIRKIGSGNIGATNVLRTGSKILALLTLIGDAGKGAFCTVITYYITHDSVFSAWVGVIAVLGHNFPIFLAFKGGKGVATTLGTLLAIHPYVGLLTIATWLLTALISHISSLSALVALAFAPIYAYFITNTLIAIPVSILCLLSFVRHKDNIVRIFHGKESKIGSNKSQDTQ